MSVWRSAVRDALVMLAIVSSGHSVWAVYEPYPLNDPSRRWAVSLTLREGYDDNLNTTLTNRQGSATSSIQPQVLWNASLDRTFLGLRYAYLATFFTDRKDKRFEDSHSVDVLFSQNFSPRLVLNINDSFRRGGEQNLIESQVGTIALRTGIFDYNSVSGDLDYSLSRRWVVSLGGGYEFKHWDLQQIAVNNDYNTYYGLASTRFTLDPRTVVGLNYRIEETDYPSATNNARNVLAHTPYLSVSRRFNPKLSASMDGGLEFREFTDGTASQHPYGDVQLNYIYAVDSSVTAGMRYETTQTQTTGQTSIYRTVEALYLFLQIGQRITQKFRVSVNSVYGINTFRDPSSTAAQGSPKEEVIQLAFHMEYAFTHWLYADADYIYDQSTSDFSSRNFDRNRGSVGVRLTY